MVINGLALLADPPIRDMLTHKHRSDNGVSYGLAEVGYDIQLKQDIHFCPPKYHNNGTPISGPSYYRDDVRFRGNMCLASTREYFDMPLDLVGIVHDKSTWARCGLSVFNTVIEPGWRGNLTLELVYHGSEDLHLPAGTGIAQVIFHKLSNAASYKGSYQDQEDCPVESLIKTI